MIRLEQVQLLESRVEKALGLIDRLKGENLGLRDKLDGYQKRIEDLEVLIRELQSDQGRIEEGILSALSKLNRFEDSLEGQASAPSPAPGRSAEVKPPPAPEAEEEEGESGGDAAESEPAKPEHPELEIF
jgi:chromosome segregation ATPase